MVHHKKHSITANGAIPSTLATVGGGNMEKSFSLQGTRQRRHNNRNLFLTSAAQDQIYSHPYKRHYQQSSSLAYRHRKKNGTTELYRPYENRHFPRPEVVPEPDYSQTDTDPEDLSVRLRNPSFWANSSDYYHRNGLEDERRPSHHRESVPNGHRNIANDDGSTLQRTRSSIPNNRRSTDDMELRQSEYVNHKQGTLSRKLRPAIDDRPHITTITLTDTGGSLGRSNGDLYRHDHSDQERRLSYRRSIDETNKDIPSTRIDSVLSPSFSNVNLLKRVNDRYKLTERLLIQLKIVALLHAFFGFAMFSLDSSKTVILWPYIEDPSEKLFVCLRVFYSIGVLAIACLTIAISCGKRSILLEIIKILCLIFLTTIVVAPAQTPLFKTIADSLQHSNVARHSPPNSPVPADQLHQGRMADEISPFYSHEDTTELPFPMPSHGKRRLTTLPVPTEIEDTLDEKQLPKGQPSRADFEGTQKSDQRRTRALSVAQHLRIAYAIFSCCHFLLTLATLIAVVRLERIS